MISAFTSAEIYRTNEFPFVGRKTRNPQTDAWLIQWGEDGRWFLLGLVRNTDFPQNSFGKDHSQQMFPGKHRLCSSAPGIEMLAALLEPHLMTHLLREAGNSEFVSSGHSLEEAKGVWYVLVEWWTLRCGIQIAQLEKVALPYWPEYLGSPPGHPVWKTVASSVSSCHRWDSVDPVPCSCLTDQEHCV